MHLLLIAAFFLCVLTGVVFVGVWFSTRQESAGVTFDQPIPSEREIAKELLQETVTRVGQAMPKEAKKTTRIEKQLEYAGYHHPNAIHTFNGIKATCACLSALLAIILGIFMDGSFDLAIMRVIAMAGVGYLLPERGLDLMVRRRASRVRSGLPVALDLLILGVEAGQSIDSALMEASRELRNGFPDLAQEFTWIQMEMSTSIGRSEAFRNLGLRNTEPEIKRFAQILVDCDRFGTGLAGALRTHVRYLRIRMRQQAREAARKVGVKLVFPVFFLIFPSVLLVTLGPAVLQLTTQLAVLLKD